MNVLNMQEDMEIFKSNTVKTCEQGVPRSNFRITPVADVTSWPPERQKVSRFLCELAQYTNSKVPDGLGLYQ